MDDVVVAEPEHKVTADEARVVPPPVLRDLQPLQVRGTISLDDEAVLNEEVHLPDARDLNMPTHLQTSPAEGDVGEDLQQLIGTGNQQVQDPSGSPVPVAPEHAPQEVEADVAIPHGALDHDEGFKLRQAMHSVDQHVGQSGHRKPRVPGMPAPAVWHPILRGRSVPGTQMQTLGWDQRPQPIAGRSRETRQLGPQFAGGAVGTGVLHQGIVSPPHPAHSAIGQCFVEADCG